MLTRQDLPWRKDEYQYGVRRIHNLVVQRSKAEFLSRTQSVYVDLSSTRHGNEVAAWRNQQDQWDMLVTLRLEVSSSDSYYYA